MPFVRSLPTCSKIRRDPLAEETEAGTLLYGKIR